MQRRLVWALVGVVGLAGGCKKDKEKGGDGEGKVEGKPETGAQDPKTPPTADATAAGQALVKKVDDCWGAYEAWNKDAFRDCHAERGEFKWMDALPPAESTDRTEAVSYAGYFRNAFSDFKAERSLIVVNGNKSLAVSRISGKHSTASMGMPPTGKTMSVLYAQVCEHDPAGRITLQHSFIEQSALLHQLGIVQSATASSEEKSWGEPIRAVGTNSEQERANVDAAKRGLEAIAKADVPNALAMYADGASFRFVPDARTYTGLKDIESLLRGYTPVDEMVVRDAWSAGDWVVAEIRSKAKLVADIPGAPGTKGKTWELNSLELMRFTGGKVTQHWSFANGLKFAADVGLFDPAALGGG